MRHNKFVRMSKTELFSTDLQETAALFKVLGHPARLAILKYLADTKMCITGDISNELPLSRTTVNQHLQELKNIDLIKGEIDGSKCNYCINTKTLAKLQKTINKYLNKIEGCC